jgi:hypothetical protein
VKFEKFEDEFEKNLKRKIPNPLSPHPFSSGLNHPFSPQPVSLFPFSFLSTGS